MTNYFRKPDALVDAVNAVLSGQPVEEKKMDPVDQKALKGKHSDRKDKDIDNDGDVDSSDEYLHKRRQAVSKAMKEGVEDNPANTQHLCAKNVVHESWGEGSCIPTMHADPDEEGNVAWYDVMFDHGIEEQVSIEELKVTKAESHIHSSKKKIKESKDEYEDDDDDSDEDEKNGKKKKVSGKKDDVDVEPEMDDTKMVSEKEMTPAQEKKREEIVLSMKKEMPRFKKKYGDRAKDVMYATATKMAMKEGFELGIEKSDLIEEVELDETVDGARSAVNNAIKNKAKELQKKYRLSSDEAMTMVKKGLVKHGSKYLKKDFDASNEETDLDEGKMGDQWQKGAKSVKSGPFELMRGKSGVHAIMQNGKKLGDFSYDDEADNFVANMKGMKGQWVGNDIDSLFTHLQKVHKEEVELDEAWTIKMPRAEGGKTVDNMDSSQVVSFIKSKGGSDRVVQSIKKGKSVTFQGKTGAFYKIIKEEVDLDEGQKPYVSMDRDGAHVLDSSGKTVKSFAMKDKQKAMDYLKKNYNKLMKEDNDLDEISRSMTPMKNKFGLSQQEKLEALRKKLGDAKLDKYMQSREKGKVQDTINALYKQFVESVELDEGRGRPRKDGTTGGSEDREHIQMQLRKSVSLRGLKDVEFADGNKVKVPAKVAQDVMSKINSIKDAKQKQNAVQHIAKSHKHMMDFHKGDYKDADTKRQDILKLK